MSNAINPGPVPSDPRTISFAAHCFADVGERVEYVVIHHAASMKSPTVFTDEAKADAYADRIGRPVTRRVVPVRRRVSWQ